MKKNEVQAINVIANGITAFCLLILTIGLMAGGSWTINTVNGLRQDYHPDKISQIVNQISDTVDVLHKTTNLLKSSPNDFDPYGEFRTFSHTLQLLVQSLDQVPLVVNEAESWRNMSESGVERLKKIVENW
jgi:hypothetical protein|tara:strand:+ start:211 stop:603 length:393 start_codon:yes stop_codon:yes gene_type:complete